MRIKKQTDDFKHYVLDQLSDLPDLICQRMFGGHGLYQGEHFFGILHAGRLYFKTDPTTRPDFEARQMNPFKPNEKQTLKNYMEVPVDVLEDRDALAVWARRAVQVSRCARRN